MLLKNNHKIIGLHIGRKGNSKICLPMKSIINGIDSIICCYKNNKEKETLIEWIFL